MLSFHSLDGILSGRKVLNFDEVQCTCFFFFFLLVLLVLYLRNGCQIKGHEELSLFSSKSFIVLAVTFRSLFHFELIFE